jgi:hypothetical protein
MTQIRKGKKTTNSVRISDLLGTFDKFWLILKEQTGKSQLNISPPHSPFRVDKVDSLIFKIALTEQIHLKDWPYKAASGSQNLHILISGFEIIDGKSSCITKSNVLVRYFEANASKELNQIEAIHYDYEENPSASHPIFHAQFCNDPLEPEEKRRIETLATYDFSENSLNRFKHLKIPTAHMGFQSILLSLCADHIPPSHNLDCIRALAACLRHQNMPKASCSFLKENIDQCDSFLSSHWYLIT